SSIYVFIDLIFAVGEGYSHIMCCKFWFVFTLPVKLTSSYGILWIILSLSLRFSSYQVQAGHSLVPVQPPFGTTLWLRYNLVEHLCLLYTYRQCCTVQLHFPARPLCDTILRPRH